MTVRVQLPLGWNNYLFFNSDIVNFVQKKMKKEGTKHCFVNFCSLTVL